MKHTHKDIEGSQREFKVEVPAEDVKKRLDDIYDQMKQTAEVPGFRKGNVPLDILKKHHGKAANERMLSDLVGSSYRRAVRESNTKPVTLPVISDVEFAEGKPLSYKATVDLMPKVDLKNYKNIKVAKKDINVKDEKLKDYVIREDMQNQIFEELLKGSHFTPPKGLVDEEAERMLQGVKGEKKGEELREKLRKEAVKKVRLYFILDEIGRLENIDVSDDETDHALTALAQQSKASKEQVEKYYVDNGLLDHLKYQLRENKIIEFLLRNAEVR